jgi:hypothetical protein
MAPEEYRLLAKVWNARSQAAPEHMKEGYEALARQLFALGDQWERTGLIKQRHPDNVKRRAAPRFQHASSKPQGS